MTVPDCINKQMLQYGIDMKLGDYVMRLSESLKPSRFIHSLAVAKLAKKMAEHWGISIADAELAGLLHDAAKCMDEYSIHDYCMTNGIAIGPAPALWHAPAAAHMLRHEWGIDNEAVLAAVASHTVARIDMNDLERIVYLADVAEEHRSYEGVDKVRKLLFEDLDAAMLCNLEGSIADLRRQDKYIAPESLHALEYYRNKCRERGNIMEENKILDLVVEAIKEKKGEDVLALEIKGLTIIADYFVIASAQNNRQAQSIADNIVEKADEAGLQVGHVEGYPEGKWVLIDLGNIIVHVFQPETRTYYNLERLWADAPVHNF